MAQDVRFSPRPHFRVLPLHIARWPTGWAKRGRQLRRFGVQRDRRRDPDPPPTDPAARVTCHGVHDPARAASALLPGDCERRFRRVLHPHVHPLPRPVFRRTCPFPAASCPHHPTSFVGFGLNALFQRSVHFSSPVGGDLPLFQLRNRPSVTSPSNSISCTAPSHGPHRSVSTEPGRCITCNAPHRGYALDRQGMTWAYSVGPCPRHPGRVIASSAGPSPRSPATFWGTSCTPAPIAISGVKCHWEGAPTGPPMSFPPFGDVIAVRNAPFLKVFTAYVL